jgi:hypothetical protein
MNRAVDIYFVKDAGNRLRKEPYFSEKSMNHIFKPCAILVVVLLLIVCGVSNVAAQTEVDVFVYGATPAGIAASVEAARHGHSVILVEPSSLIGGMISGGLTKTDIGRKDTVGGLPDEFFQSIVDDYDATYGKNSVQSKQTNGGIFFEPHVAARVFNKMLAQAGVTVHRQERILSVEIDGGRIVAARTAGQSAEENYRAKMFIDASYEGDLMAVAGVPYRVGREAADEYGESFAGLRTGPQKLLGTGDHRLQSFNIRSTLTNRDDIRLPIPKPAQYMPEAFESFIQHVHEKNLKNFNDLFPDVPLWGPVNGKSDPNKADDIGANIDYAEASPEARQRSYEHTRDLWLTFWYMLQNDSRLTPEFRESAKKWGLPKDEFVDSQHVSPQLYVREARRMLGRYVMSQNDVQTDRFKADGVAIGSYGIDSHPVQMIRTPAGLTEEGGDLGGWTDPYNIPYRSLTPYSPQNLLVVVDISATHIAYCSVRMEPVFMMLGEVGGTAASQAIESGTSVQDISITALRTDLKKQGIPLEPPFRPSVDIQFDGNPVLGQPVYFKVDQKEIRSPLVRYYWNFDGSGELQATTMEPVWTFPADKPWLVSLLVEDRDGNRSLVARKIVQVGTEKGPADVTLPFDQAKQNGLWDRTARGGLDERDLTAYHDLNLDKGIKSATFDVKLSRSGQYLVALAFPAGPTRATNVPIRIRNGQSEYNIKVDERHKPGPFAFVPIGKFTLDAASPLSINIGTGETDGDVAVEAVRWIWLGSR